MSDALSDLARDEQRSRGFRSYLIALKAFLQTPTAKNKVQAVQMAEATDNVRGGFWGGRTSLAKTADEVISKLQAGDKETWAKFLFTIKDDSLFPEFKALSPFAGKMIIVADYGCGFVRFSGELESFVESLISDGKGWRTYDADKFIVVLDEPKRDDIDVVWAGSGRLGATGPSNARK